MKFLACNPDGFTFFGLLFLILFIGVMGGLLSKDKQTRQNALIASTGIVVVSSLVLYALNC